MKVSLTPTVLGCGYPSYQRATLLLLLTAVLTTFLEFVYGSLCFLTARRYFWNIIAVLFGIVQVEIVFCTENRWRTGHNGLGCEPKVLEMEPDATWLDAIVAYWYFPTAMLES
jgi:hypothetical protein